ncbi:hypothetical protein AS594_13570 [Streptomyces agglomeratus]|uniref:Uncharacterized protein n=1 Tax=Streptomyces agglomeratus TaxID=285458 RepID=A0A1E5P7J8_9ACTN|nr:hypothetical protein AS594_13570 [Streptomyces agglomeratus]
MHIDRGSQKNGRRAQVVNVFTGDLIGDGVTTGARSVFRNQSSIFLTGGKKTAPRIIFSAVLLPDSKQPLLLRGDRANFSLAVTVGHLIPRVLYQRVNLRLDNLESLPPFRDGKAHITGEISQLINKLGTLREQATSGVKAVRASLFAKTLLKIADLVIRRYAIYLCAKFTANVRPISLKYSPKRIAPFGRACLSLVNNRQDTLSLIASILDDECNLIGRQSVSAALGSIKHLAQFGLHFFSSEHGHKKVAHLG